ncbi:hypothetical protein VNO80_29163 [Phaseolus coccineus]|uniref:Uncharacterized protein n=1 Tax=Phaseolus coccineus TaxID=3886 RepID=A0AAN9LAF5_PHACN
MQVPRKGYHPQKPSPSLSLSSKPLSSLPRFSAKQHVTQHINLRPASESEPCSQQKVVDNNFFLIFKASAAHQNED